MSDGYVADLERQAERMMLETLLEQASADERALEAALSAVDPSVLWESAAPELPSLGADPLANQLAVSQARADWMRSRWEAAQAHSERQRERQSRTLDSYLGGGELSLDLLIAAAQSVKASKPAPTLAGQRAAGQARKDAEHKANQARAALIRERRS